VISITVSLSVLLKDLHLAYSNTISYLSICNESGWD